MVVPSIRKRFIFAAVVGQIQAVDTYCACNFVAGQFDLFVRAYKTLRMAQWPEERNFVDVDTVLGNVGVSDDWLDGKEPLSGAWLQRV